MQCGLLLGSGKLGRTVGGEVLKGGCEGSGLSRADQCLIILPLSHTEDPSQYQTMWNLNPAGLWQVQVAIPGTVALHMLGQIMSPGVLGDSWANGVGPLLAPSTCLH